MKNTFSHQGDICFYSTEEKLKGTPEKHSGEYIVGYGEATGHTHTVHVANPDDLEIVKVADGFVMRLKSEGIVRHQEHKEIKLAPGTYRIGHEREYDHFQHAARRVVD